jgi:glycosyltransferase involved in cell wall biosynthesis
VFAPGDNSQSITLNNINLVRGEFTDFEKLINKYLPDFIFCHWIVRKNKKYFDFLLEEKIPIGIFIHGYEGLIWWRRLFHLADSDLRTFLIYIQSNMRQLWFLRKFISKANRIPQIGFIFVSEWMKKITESDTKIRIKNNRIIPNSINFNLFHYHKKDRSKRFNIVSIRSFTSKKYAADVLFKVLLNLKQQEFFNDLNIKIYGQTNNRSYSQSLYNQFENEIKNFPNVTLHQGMISHTEMNQVFQFGGIFLGPTRQDSQGVIMCEAAACGLVPIVSNNTAIPDFVDPNFGFLCNTIKDFTNSIKVLIQDPDRYEKMSFLAHKKMKELDSKNIIQKELEFSDYLIGKQGVI